MKIRADEFFGNPAHGPPHTLAEIDAVDEWLRGIKANGERRFPGHSAKRYALRCVASPTIRGQYFWSAIARRLGASKEEIRSAARGATGRTD